jgi:hypothetical protein
VDATLYMDTLRMVLGGSATRAATRPAQRVLDDALAGRSLPVHEWRQLARYDWSEGEQRLVPDGQRARTLLRLARSCPAHLKVSQTRFLLKAAAASAPPGRPGALDEEGRFAAGAALTRMLGDPSQARDLMDLVTHDVQPVLAALTRDGTPGRVQLQRVWDQAAARLVADDGLSRSERLGAWQVRVELARMGRLPGDASLPPTLLGELQNHVDQWVRDSADAQERQSVVPAAAHLLAEAGRVAQAQQLLKAQLGQVVAPHFLMGQLASLARRRGDMADALQWSRLAWEQARGAGCAAAVGREPHRDLGGRRGRRCSRHRIGRRCAAHRTGRQSGRLSRAQCAGAGTSGPAPAGLGGPASGRCGRSGPPGSAPDTAVPAAAGRRGRAPAVRGTDAQRRLRRSDASCLERARRVVIDHRGFRCRCDRAVLRVPAVCCNRACSDLPAA